MPTMLCEGNAKFEFSISEHEMISSTNDELDHPYAVGRENKPTVGPSPFKEEGKENDVQGILEHTPCSIPMTACLWTENMAPPS